MNGKNRRTKGCWTRGYPKPGSITSLNIPPQSPYYNLPTFSSSLKSNLINDTQRNLVNFFEAYSYVEKTEEYSYNSNTSYAIINLRNSHFTNGTVRITKPGIYVLQENITFHPNETNDFMPTAAQISSGLYPVGENGAYQLGFFASITVETNLGVIIDLNGKTIQQSVLHDLQQRFYANIELAGAPFIPNQGPAPFSSDSTFKTSDQVLVMNGTLGLSSHHGIHGNQMSRVILKNLTVKNFEVAGIALNGATNSILDTITIKDTLLNVRVLSSFSQSRFIRPFLTTVANRETSPTFNSLTMSTIQNNLINALDAAKTAVMAGNTPSNMFGNPDFAEGYDGNVYGLVLNVNGVVVNDFITTRPGDAIGNENIYMENISISNIISKPIEIIALNNDVPGSGAYGGGRQVGPAGDVLDIHKITDSDKYNGNVLSDAQMIIAKYNAPKVGKTNIKTEIVDWAENNNNNTDLTDVMNANSYYFVTAGDSMGHFMKGNIGMFISAGKNIKMKNYTINNVVNHGDTFEDISLQNPGHVGGTAPGGNSYGMAIVGSTSITENGTNTITNITKTNGVSMARDKFQP